MRLFTAIALPPELLERLAGLLDRLRPEARIGWSAPENLHITTKFVGEFPDARLGELQSALEPVRFEPIPIAIRGIGWFPNPHNPRVLWTGVQAPASLTELARATESALEPLGVAKEDRAYAPHLTLARIKERLDLAPLRRAIAGLESTDFGSFTADCFFLYQSKTRPSGSVYTKLADYRCSTAPKTS